MQRRFTHQEEEVMEGRSKGIGGMIASGILAVVAVVAILALVSSCTPVKFGTVKAVTQFGQLTGTMLKEGLNFKTPFIQGTETYDTQNQIYEASENPDTSEADFTDFPVGAQTSDGQQVEITYTVVFRLEEENVIQVLRRWGSMKDVLENIIKTDSRSWVRKLAQNFPAEELYSGEGIIHFEDEVRSKLLETYGGAGITLDEFLVRKISFDPDYVLAIEQQQIAQEQIETAQFNAQAAEFKRDEAIRLAEAEKQRNILLAEATAQQTVLEATAEATAIELQGAALRKYPEVMQWEFVQNLKGVQWGILPADGIMPLLQMPKFTN